MSFTQVYFPVAPAPPSSKSCVIYRGHRVYVFFLQVCPIHALRAHLSFCQIAIAAGEPQAWRQVGSRGSADPLDAYGAEYHVGIVDKQVCFALPLAHPCKPRPASHAFVPILAHATGC